MSVEKAKIEDSTSQITIIYMNDLIYQKIITK